MDLDRRRNPYSRDLTMRRSSIQRTTNETQISVSINLDGNGSSSITTGIGFFDHMLDQLARHSLMDLEVTATGDLHIDQHHTVEDVGITIGQALKEALGEKRGIVRYGHAYLPMDETLARACVDISGRPFLVFKAQFHTGKIGEFDTQLVREFFQAFSMNAGITLHIESLYGVNDHHIAESSFKAVARSLRMAIAPDNRQLDVIPSTKGQL